MAQNYSLSKQGLEFQVCSENMIDPQCIRLDYQEQDDVLFCLYTRIYTRILKFANVACQVTNNFELRESGIWQQISIVWMCL